MSPNRHRRRLLKQSQCREIADDEECRFRRGFAVISTIGDFAITTPVLPNRIVW